eukprot:s1453_g12.t1
MNIFVNAIASHFLTSEDPPQAAGLWVRNGSQFPHCCFSRAARMRAQWLKSARQVRGRWHKQGTKSGAVNCAAYRLVEIL